MRVLAPGRSLLLYRATCPKCRLLSRIVVVLSCASVARAPISSPEAELVTQMYPHSKGKLALLDRDRIVTGWGVVPAVLSCLIRTWIHTYGRS